jgi:hypothetical protein
MIIRPFALLVEPPITPDRPLDHTPVPFPNCSEIHSVVETGEALMLIEFSSAALAESVTVHSFAVAVIDEGTIRSGTGGIISKDPATPLAIRTAPATRLSNAVAVVFLITQHK